MPETAKRTSNVIYMPDPREYTAPRERMTWLDGLLIIGTLALVWGVLGIILVRWW